MSPRTLVLLTILTSTTTCPARGADWGRLLRGATRVGDDVPVRGLEEAVEDLAKSRSVRHAVDDRLGRNLDELSPAARGSDVAE